MSEFIDHDSTLPRIKDFIKNRYNIEPIETAFEKNRDKYSLDIIYKSKNDYDWEGHYYRNIPDLKAKNTYIEVLGSRTCTIEAGKLFHHISGSYNNAVITNGTNAFIFKSASTPSELLFRIEVLYQYGDLFPEGKLYCEKEIREAYNNVVFKRVPKYPNRSWDMFVPFTWNTDYSLKFILDHLLRK